MCSSGFQQTQNRKKKKKKSSRYTFIITIFKYQQFQIQTCFLFIFHVILQIPKKEAHIMCIKCELKNYAMKKESG